MPLSRKLVYLAGLMIASSLARGELVLANFSSTNPIKVMAIGDSITDDCVANGAWRQYLQPLLESNNFPFIFVGRQNSTPSGSFTKTAHEGYCGAVIAPPGVATAPVHGYAGSDVYLQKIVQDALTNATPDLVLLLIGVNDIGHGRDPFQVATNDMSTLLDIIFSNAPNANIILSKVTSLLNANLSGLNYANYATNIYTYNAALQAMVNQRRSLGQNVFLADVFSVLNSNPINTQYYYNTDGVHPNTAGLQIMAQEWLTRIQSITISSNLLAYTLVKGGATWKYLDTGVNLGTNWSQPGYDDSGWSSGPSRLGWGDADEATTVSYGGNPTNRNMTTYFRRWFTVPNGVQITNLNIRLTRVDGAVVWLNGNEAIRTNMPVGIITNATAAVRKITQDNAYTFYQTSVPVANMTAGTNLLAVEVHLNATNRPVMGFDLETLGSGYYLPQLALSIAVSGGNLSVSWPLTNSSGYTLYSTTNLASQNSWSPISAALTNGSQLVVTQSTASGIQFFRLQK